MQKMRQWDSFDTSFFILKVLYEVKARGMNFSFNAYLDRPQLSIQ